MLVVSTICGFTSLHCLNYDFKCSTIGLNNSMTVGTRTGSQGWLGRSSHQFDSVGAGALVNTVSAGGTVISNAKAKPWGQTVA
jgi:hypothetical protein